MWMPFSLLLNWVAGLFSLALLGGGAYLLWEWYQRAEAWHQRVDHSHVWYEGFQHEPLFLLGGLALLLWSLFGRAILLRLLRRPGDDEPQPTRDGAVERITRPDGTELQVELYGPAEAQPIVLTHGWGVHGTVWYYAKRHLADRFRLVVWDLPGLGKSRHPRGGAQSIDEMAEDLKAVVDVAGEKPVILLGHSIGGMITQTFCRRHPEYLGRRVAALILSNSTYTNPTRTSVMSGLATALQKPVMEPLLHLTILLWPLAWLMNWMSYLNGSTLLNSRLTGFTGGETRGQLHFADWFNPRCSPAVIARGMLAMLRFDESATLDGVRVPVLVISGDRDPMCRPDASDIIAGKLSEAKQVELKPASHMGFLEQHERWAEAVDSFSARLGNAAEGSSEAAPIGGAR